MAIVAKYLLDTSAAARLRHPSVSNRLAPLIGAGLVATCAPLDFEALYSAENKEDYAQRRWTRQYSYEYLPSNDEEWQRALDIQRMLVATSRWRAVGLADLIVAATAERHSVTLLHYDSDFDIVASVTGQPMEWVVPRGSLPD